MLPTIINEHIVKISVGNKRRFNAYVDYFSVTKGTSYAAHVLTQRTNDRILYLQMLSDKQTVVLVGLKSRVAVSSGGGRAADGS